MLLAGSYSQQSPVLNLVPPWVFLIWFLGDEHFLDLVSHLPQSSSVLLPHVLAQVLHVFCTSGDSIFSLASLASFLSGLLASWPFSNQPLFFQDVLDFFSQMSSRPSAVSFAQLYELVLARGVYWLLNAPDEGEGYSEEEDDQPPSYKSPPRRGKGSSDDDEGGPPSSSAAAGPQQAGLAQ